MKPLVIECNRVDKGKPVVKEIEVEYRDYYPGQLPIVTIKANWQPKKEEYRDQTDYSIEEFPCSGEWDGRGFRLTKLEDANDVYDIFIHRHGGNSHCDCKGFVSHHKCKHHDAVQALIDCGHLSDPHDMPELVAVHDEMEPF